jgi:hypothetical protein
MMKQKEKAKQGRKQPRQGEQHSQLLPLSLLIHSNDWLVISPEPVPKKKQTATTKRKRRIIIDNDNDWDAEVQNSTRGNNDSDDDNPQKRRKKVKAADSDSEERDKPRKSKQKAKQRAPDPDEDEAVNIIGYVHVLKPTSALLPPTRGRGVPKLKPESLYIERGPFKFLSDCSFDHFLSALAISLPCPVEDLVLDKITWVPQTPANRAPLPLGGAIGFDVLREEFISRTKARVVILTMPAPKKP